MWHEHIGTISIGCQNGGPIDNGIGTIKVDLWRLTMEHCKSTYCPSIDHFAIALRVGGKFADWTPERIHRIRRDRKNRLIGCDIDIPVTIWEHETTDKLKEYLALKVRESIVLMVARLKKDKELIDDISLFKELDNAIMHFKKKKYKNIA